MMNLSRLPAFIFRILSFFIYKLPRASESAKCNTLHTIVLRELSEFLHFPHRNFDFRVLKSVKNGL